MASLCPSGRARDAPPPALCIPGARSPAEKTDRPRGGSWDWRESGRAGAELVLRGVCVCSFSKCSQSPCCCWSKRSCLPWKTDAPREERTWLRSQGKLGQNTGRPHPESPPTSPAASPARVALRAGSVHTAVTASAQAPTRAHRGRPGSREGAPTSTVAPLQSVAWPEWSLLSTTEGARPPVEAPGVGVDRTGWEDGREAGDGGRKTSA